MVDKIINDAKNYSDLSGLERLRYQSRKDPFSAKKEVSQQFEALFIQILLKSMRDANKAFSSDLFGGNQMDMYQDMYDKQLSLLMSNSGIGLAAEIEKNIDRHYASQTASSNQPKTFKLNQPSPKNLMPIKQVGIKATKDEPTQIVAIPNEKIEAKQPQPFSSQEDFVKSLWSSAKLAARLLDTDPRILIAQAALETNWGKKVVTDLNTSTYNLFNIKADSNWGKSAITKQTLEQQNGILVKEKASFRSYSSYNESFMDYVHFLKTNTRYKDALNKAPDPKQFTYALQDAGFATDKQYAEKILSIFSSNSFKNIVKNLE